MGEFAMTEYDMTEFDKVEFVEEFRPRAPGNRRAVIRPKISPLSDMERVEEPGSRP
jgi:hypothetical protein